ncbi:MAG: hypothetical protein ACYDCJ_12140 [Gammaproteobacteria bacterium]
MPQVNQEPSYSLRPSFRRMPAYLLICLIASIVISMLARRQSLNGNDAIPVGIFIVILTLMFLYMGDVISKVRLIVTDAGLKRIFRSETFIPWGEMKFIQTYRNRHNKIRNIVIITSKKHVFTIGNFENMDDIAAQIAAHAPALQPLERVDAAILKVSGSWVIGAIGLTGLLCLGLSQGKEVYRYIGYSLLLIAALPTLFLFRNNLLSASVSKKVWLRLGNHLLVFLAIWILIVVAVIALALLTKH